MTGQLDEERKRFAEDVRIGLSAKRRVLPPKYFYDPLGSQLFEAICQLPWYPITRAEMRLLERSAAEMVAPFGEVAELCELGSGSGEKLARIARVLSGRGGRLDVHLVDISQKALDLAQDALGRIPHVRVVPHCASFEDGLAAIAARDRRSARGARIVCFLGSNIGNFELDAAAVLLTAIRASLRPGDGLLLGADLVRAEADLLLAYDDPLGVTAAFNKNVLLRINKELGGDFDLHAFTHRAVWDREASRIEMHLVSTKHQVAHVAAAGIEAAFEEGETIWTESSYKYTRASLVELGRRAGLTCRRQWIDEAGGFATTLFVA